jgi:DNA-binding MarR family transcriptional regulator
MAYNRHAHHAMTPRKTRLAAPLEASEYQQLAAFRHALRRFLRFSEAAAEQMGLSAQHYQAMLALCAGPGGRLTINELAQQLLIRHNSAVGLVDRLSKQGLALREPSPEDKRKVYLRLTAKGDRVLARLAEVHREELRRIGPELRAQLLEIAKAQAGSE